jgi:hypothetical protein
MASVDCNRIELGKLVGRKYFEKSKMKIMFLGVKKKH